MDNTELLAEARLAWLGPSTTLLSTDDENLLRHGDRIIEDEIIPRLIDIFEEFLIQEERITLTSGTSKYRIPDRAIDGQVREVSFRTSLTQRPSTLDPINRNEKNFFSTTGQPIAFYLESDYIVVLGDPSGFLEVSFPFKPGSLVTSDNFRKVTDVNTTTGEIDLDSAVPTSWTTSSTFDVHSHRGAQTIANWDLTASVVSGTDMTFSAASIDGSAFGRRVVEVGNYVVLKGKAASPMVPEGLHGLIAQGIATRIAKSQADVENYQILRREYQSNFKQKFKMLDSRLEQKRTIVNWNSRFRRSSGLFSRRGHVNFD